MKLVVLFYLLALSIDARYTVPSKTFVSLNDLKGHPARTVDVGRESLRDAYIQDVKIQIESLIKTVEDEEDFHLDSLVFSLKRTTNILGKDGLLSREPWKGNHLSPEDYDRLIRITSEHGFPGINLDVARESILRDLSKKFVENYDILYVDNIFDEWTLNQMRTEVDRLWRSRDIEPNCNLNGVDRLGGYVHHSKNVSFEEQKSSLYSLIFGNEPLRLWVSAIVGVPHFPSDFPIELREYGNNSRGMACHSDVQMYADVTRNLEMVVTVSNYGKCEVYWYDRENVRHSVWPAPNSITLVRPGSAVHCVSDTKGDYREILKFILVGDYHKHPNFYDYVDNACSKSNPNVSMLKKRRIQRTKEAAALNSNVNQRRNGAVEEL
jgi:hypothetical protein